MNSRRGAKVLAVLLAAGPMAACGQHEDRASVAAAKCTVPVMEALRIPPDAFIGTSQVQVTSLGHGSYRVTGVAEARGRTDTGYTCEVVPDPSDRLRGFRVTHLTLG